MWISPLQHVAYSVTTRWCQSLPVVLLLDPFDFVTLLLRLHVFKATDLLLEKNQFIKIICFVNYPPPKKNPYFFAELKKAFFLYETLHVSQTRMQRKNTEPLSELSPLTVANDCKTSNNIVVTHDDSHTTDNLKTIPNRSLNSLNHRFLSMFSYKIRRNKDVYKK